MTDQPADRQRGPLRKLGDMRILNGRTLTEVDVG
jgi:hypothetical protein